MLGLSAGGSFANAQSSTSAPTLPLTADEALEMSPRMLAELIFASAPDAVISAEPVHSYLVDKIFGATFLLRGQPAVEDSMVRYDGLCSLRRVTIYLDAGEGLDQVEDIETDTVYAVLGPPSIIRDPDPFDGAASEDGQKDTSRREACAAFRDVRKVVTAPGAGVLMGGLQALNALPDLLARHVRGISCDPGRTGAACPADMGEKLLNARLYSVTTCENSGFTYGLRVPSGQSCFVIELTTSAGISEEAGLRVVATGAWDMQTPFVPTRAILSETTTYID